MGRIRIRGVDYEAASIEDITLRDTLVFEQQMAELGRRMSWPDLMKMVLRLAAIEDPAERGTDPDAMWSMAVTVWASMRKAGEQVTIAEAIDFPLSEIVFIDDAPTPTTAGAGTIAPADDAAPAGSTA